MCHPLRRNVTIKTLCSCPVLFQEVRTRFLTSWTGCTLTTPCVALPGIDTRHTPIQPSLADPRMRQGGFHVCYPSTVHGH